jgi:glutamate-ammonia-ligase adenylyltransferase
LSGSDFNSSAASTACVAKRLPAAAAAQLPQLLNAAGDPAQALRLLEELCQRHPNEAAAAFASGELALRACVLLFGCSQWLASTLLQSPELLSLFSRPGGLSAERTIEDFHGQFARFRLNSPSELSELLARFKRREYVRIFARELLGIASIAVSTAEISALSDVLIGQALAHCEDDLRRLYSGWPQLRSAQGRVYPARFAVLALGKLGGNELNYSSDIDLLFLFDDSGEDADSNPISAREFFTRLAQELTAILCKVGAEGQLFRVDLRLRPQGTSGEIVGSSSQALRYYRSEAHDWERQALLKLRLSAGDRSLAREFIEQAHELIYSGPHNLSAIQTAARSLERMHRRRNHRSPRSLDVKNGHGGIREIEFLVQCLQRVHGGREPWLRSSGTISALHKLHDKGHIGDAEFRELGECYRLLRAIEHRLQCRQGVQTHRLPGSPAELAALFRSLGEPGMTSLTQLERTMRSSAELCARVLRVDEDAGREPLVFPLRLASQGAARLVAEISSRSPLLAQALSAPASSPLHVNLHRFLAGASTSRQRTSTIAADLTRLEAALPVFAASAFATSILARHSEDISALFDPQHSIMDPGAPPLNSPVAGELKVGQLASADSLRIASRRNSLKTIARSLLERRPIWEILNKHSQAFDGILRRAFQALSPPEGMALMAVGRLGTNELDLVSDADLVFLRGAGCSAEAAEHAARTLVTTLSAYTREGLVITVDTRIRPHGGAGELVVSSRQLRHYFESEAKPWEALAFAKMRWIAGDAALAEQASAAVEALRLRFAASPSLVPDLRSVRRRLEEAGPIESLKSGPGSLYDLDFISGLLELRAGLPTAGRQQCERLPALVAEGLLSPAQGRELLSAVELFRRVDHAIRLVEGKARKWLPANEGLRRQVEEIVGIAPLEPRLRSHMEKVRAAFNSVFSD